MKKTFFAIAAVAALAMGCAKEQQPSDAPADQGKVTTIRVTVAQTKSFWTLPHPYDVQAKLNISSATDLSSSASANCYIVSNVGLYKFKAVMGNSSESVGAIASASILWETFGTSETPEYFDLING